MATRADHSRRYAVHLWAKGCGKLEPQHVAQKRTAKRIADRFVRQCATEASVYVDDTLEGFTVYAVDGNAANGLTIHTDDSI